MHTGRYYRRLRPPIWFRNFSEFYDVAFQWDLRAEYIYAGTFSVTRPEPRLRVKDLSLKEGWIEWATKYSAGVYDFGILMRFQLKQHTPFHQWTFRMFDNFGSLLESSIMVIYDYNFSASNTIWTCQGFPDIKEAGLFGHWWKADLYPISYHQEP